MPSVRSLKPGSSLANLQFSLCVNLVESLQGCPPSLTLRIPRARSSRWAALGCCCLSWSPHTLPVLGLHPQPQELTVPSEIHRARLTSGVSHCSAAKAPTSSPDVRPEEWAHCPHFAQRSPRPRVVPPPRSSRSAG